MSGRPIRVSLGDFTSSGGGYFTSRSRGVDISRKLELESLAEKELPVVIHFPRNLTGINSIFLEELLEPAILSLNEGTSFNDVYVIENESLYNVEALVDKTVQYLEQKKAEYAL